MENPTDIKYLIPEELEKIKEIQEETQILIYELGEIELFKLQLEERYNQSKSKLEILKSKEYNFNQEVLEKYGKININPNTGEIIPIL